MARMAKMVKAAKCTCNPAWLIASAILYAIGILLLAQGFTIQFQEGLGQGVAIFGYYFVGVLLIGVGKFVKWKSCAMCPVHGTMQKM